MIILINNVSAQLPGDIDLTFNPQINFNINNEVKTIVTQTDGKMLLGGTFINYNNTNSNRILRLNSDGTLDNSFSIGTGFNDVVNAIAIQTDGKILVAGSFTSYNNSVVNRIVRLNNDGTIDNTFNLGTGFNDYINKLVIQTDGKIILGGVFTNYNGTTHNRIIRLMVNGAVDNSFIGSFNNINNNDEVYAIALQTDGKILIGSRYFFGRLNTNGTTDSSFNYGSGILQVYSIVIQPDNKIVVSGYGTQYQGSINGFVIVRMYWTGLYDTSFTPMGISGVFGAYGTGSAPPITSLALQSDGKILAGGNLTSYIGTNVNKIVRLNTNGYIDNTFNIGNGFNKDVYSISVLSDGKILVGGQFDNYNVTECNRIIKLNADGTVNNNFGWNIGFNNTVNAIATQTDGKIIVGGDYTSYNSTSINRLIRLNTDGSIDSSFNIGNGFDKSVNAVAIQSDGKIVVGGLFTNYNGVSARMLIRLNSDGSIDNSFINGGYSPSTSAQVETIKIQSDGKILVSGSIVQITRLNPDGSPDSTFNLYSNPVYWDIPAICIQNDGKIVIGGRFAPSNGSFNILRLNNNGSRDVSFNAGGTGFQYPAGDVKTIALQSDGKLLAGGIFPSYNGLTSNKIIRLNSDGSKDNSFVIGSGFNNDVYSIIVQSDGKILVGGKFTSYNGIGVTGITRLNNDGTLDNTFVAGTRFDNYVNSIAIQSDGKILTGGEFINYNEITLRRIIRLNGNSILSINDIELKDEFNLEYINPIKNLLNIKSNNIINSIAVFNIDGKKIKEESYNQKEIIEDVSNLASGIYFLNISSQETYKVIKIIKE